MSFKQYGIAGLFSATKLLAERLASKDAEIEYWRNRSIEYEEKFNKVAEKSIDATQLHGGARPAFYEPKQSESIQLYPSRRERQTERERLFLEDEEKKAAKIEQMDRAKQAEKAAEMLIK